MHNGMRAYLSYGTEKITRKSIIGLICICLMATLLLPYGVLASDTADDIADTNGAEVGEDTESVGDTDEVDETNASKLYEYVNSDNGYRAFIDDQANLLNESEKNDLLSEMEKITAYGNAAFNSIDANSSSVESYASGYYHNKFDADSGVLFLIDMDNRKIYIFSDGEIYKIITKSYANTITDNVYTYASDSEYYKCASEAFSQIYTLLDGRRIAQPMKYVSNILLALVCSLLVNYIVVRLYARAKTPSRNELLDGMFVNKEINNAKAVFTHETKKYDPIETGSSGGGGGHSGGGGGGGGHSSGGGGGHSF